MLPKSIKHSVFIIFLGTFLNACAPVAAPIFESPDFHKEKITEITVLPVADLRPDKNMADKKIEKLDVWAQRGLRFAFRRARAKYHPVFVEDRTLVEKISAADLSDLNPDWVKKLGPADARWVMLPVLNHFEQKTGLAGKVNAFISAYLFDKQSGKKIWYHEDKSELSGGPLRLELAQDCIKLGMQNMAYHLPKQKLE